ncbi:MAG: aspartate carbamoyltransferase catalytic subunit [Firmicutes bacterium]|nr:aspartate carbamoyltransferase catalytic subunit [Bacillota bacterium]
MAWQRKDLLGLADLSADETETLLRSALSFKDVFQRSVRKFPTLRGKTVVNLFYEPSTRTRSSFEIAGKWLSADVINVTVSNSSVVKGESLKDTAKTLEAMGVDAIILRHSVAGTPHYLARCCRPAIINAGDGAHEHPTQALLDLLTLKERWASFQEKQVLVIGDIRHSRVAKSNIYGLRRLGAKVAVCGPATLIPPGLEHLGVKVVERLDDAVLESADLIYVLRIQRERQEEGLFPSLREYSHLFGLNAARMERTKPEVIVMHPGPANLGVEITTEIAYSKASSIQEQVTNGVAVRMAVLYHLVGGGRQSVDLD